MQSIQMEIIFLEELIVSWDNYNTSRKNIVDVLQEVIYVEKQKVMIKRDFSSPFQAVILYKQKKEHTDKIRMWLIMSYFSWPTSFSDINIFLQGYFWSEILT